MGGDQAVACGQCGEVAPDGATWCEACGHELATKVSDPCTACGERTISDDGYCLTCGHRQPRERDHLVLVDDPVVAVSDRGRRHHHNEDAVAIGRTGPGGDHLVLVVCDGVSSTPGSAEASARAAAAARDELVAALADDPAMPGPALMARAVELAQHQAASSAEQAVSVDGVWVGDGPPSSTLVAVVVRPGSESSDGSAELVTGWVGDSRAYWIAADGDGSSRLTGEDHALSGSLVRWLGADSLDPTADVAVTTVERPGRVVVCSDGLWRYAAEAEELEALVAGLVGEGRDGSELAEALVAHANDQGGHDNITVATAYIDPKGEA